MVKQTQEYINLKIKNCEELIRSATSKPQREIYEAYKEYWEKEKGIIEQKKEKLDMIKQTKVIVNNAKEELEVELEESAVDTSKTRCPICLEEFSNQGFPKHYEACKRRDELEKELETAKAELEAESTEKPNI